MEYACLTTSLETARTLNLSYNSAEEWVTDIPCCYGGLGEMPTPLHLLASSISSCMATCIYLRATELGLPGQGVRIEAAVKEDKVNILGFDFHIFVPHTLASIESEIEEIARTCHIMKIIRTDLSIDISVSFISKDQADSCG